MNDTPHALPIEPRAIAWSAPAAELADRPVLVLMHGYASDETDLFGLSPYLPLTPVIASLRAPIPQRPGFAWFPPEDGQVEHPSPASADAAARGVLAWIDTLRPDQPIGLLGFSQGGAMVLQLMRHAPERFAFGVQLSGFVVPGELDSDAALQRRRPEIFWGRGTADTVIDAEAIERTAEWLPDHTRLDSRIYEGLSHGISGQELTDVSAFIRRHFP